MTETTLMLCKQPVLGVMMWLASMCVTNQALKEIFIDVSSPGVILNHKIDIPMDEKYSFLLSFRPANPEKSVALGMPLGSHVCNSLQVEEKEFKPSLSLEIKIETIDGRLIRKEHLTPQCSDSSRRSNTLGFGQIDMKRGKYNFILTVLHPVAPNGSGKVQAIFRGQGAGFP